MREPDSRMVTRIVRRMLVECLTDSQADRDKSASGKTLFDAPETQAIKEEIVTVGKKLWMREYVDGNGGNISCRVSPDLVLCTPTFCSKGDLTAQDLCLVSLDNEQITGDRVHTSEILLHLEIYKTVPAAKAVVHCHPPHATAYAIAGLVPPVGIVPEHEVIVGPVALAAYDTPGTKSFAETVVPYVTTHNTILLQNHGVVCWADTVTHAEWCVEVVDAYCRTLILASQTGNQIRRIPKQKIAALLEIKKRLGLPDARLQNSTEQPRTRPLVKDYQRSSRLFSRRMKRENAFESLVTRITDQIMHFGLSLEPRK